MKKILFFISTVLLLFVISACGRLNTNPIRIPEQPYVEYVVITDPRRTFEIEKNDCEWIASLIEQFEFFEPTGKEYRNDTPRSVEFISLGFIGMAPGIAWMYVYHENDKWYIYQPYNGVFLVNDIFVDMLYSAKYAVTNRG